MKDDTRQLLEELRGTPSKCDFCLRELPSEDLDPEEGGLWYCWDCFLRWEHEDMATMVSQEPNET